MKNPRYFVAIVSVIILIIRPEHAIAFAAISGIAGIALLAQVNTLTAILGGANLLLYTSIYTPMKRISILNTWVGSVGKLL